MMDKLFHDGKRDNYLLITLTDRNFILNRHACRRGRDVYKGPLTD